MAVLLSVWPKVEVTVADAASEVVESSGVEYFTITNTSGNPLRWGSSQAMAESVTEGHTLAAAATTLRIVSNDPQIWIHAPTGGGIVTADIFRVGGGNRG